MREASSSNESVIAPVTKMAMNGFIENLAEHLMNEWQQRLNAIPIHIRPLNLRDRRPVGKISWSRYGLSTQESWFAPFRHVLGLGPAYAVRN